MDSRQIISKLTGPDSPARGALAELIVDSTLARPVASLLAADDVLALIWLALTPDTLAQQMDRHVQPGLVRIMDTIDRAADSSLGTWVPDGARAAIEELVERKRQPRGEWLRGAIEPGLMRELLAPVVQDVLVQFAVKVPAAVGMGFAGQASQQDASAEGQGGKRRRSSLLGQLSREVSRSTERLVSAGRSAMDGLGIDVDSRIRSLAREFGQGANEIMRSSFAERVRSEEGKQLVTRIRAGAMAHIWQASVSDILHDVDRIPLRDVLRLVPPIVAHHAQRQLGRDLISAEVHAWYEQEGQRAVAELLEQAGLLHEVRNLALRQVDDQARVLVSSDAFAVWLQELLTS